jgi:hypothetical protein
LFDELKNRYQFDFSDEQWKYIQHLERNELAIKTDWALRLTNAGLLLADRSVLELLTK